mgnify:CR=1 FL=1
MNSKNRKTTLMPLLDVILVLVSMLLSIISSFMAYQVSSIAIVIIMCVIVMCLDMLRFFNKTGTVVIRDVCILVSVILTTASMCLMILGRLNLMGYVWFSDLESGNATAVTALNLSAVAWGIFIVSIVIKIVIGFKKD